MIDLKSVFMVLLIGNMVLTAISFLILKFNDLKHTIEKLDSVEDKVDKIKEEQIGQGERISKIEGIIENK